MADDSALDLLRGTLDLLVLKALASGPLHGYAIAKWVKAASRQAFTLEDRALYLALHRLEAKRVIRGRWVIGASGRRAKQYELTSTGRDHLAADISRWERYVRAMRDVLRTDVL